MTPHTLTDLQKHLTALRRKYRQIQEQKAGARGIDELKTEGEWK